MLIADMIHACSNAHVAEAAVTSIGGGFAERVAIAANRNGLGVGRFVAAVVRDFARGANDETIFALRQRIAGDDQPLLRGLVCVLEPALEEGAMFFDDEEADFAFGMLRGDRYRSATTRVQ
jgi:hypothetical protein